jgi:hypothetical protein
MRFLGGLFLVIGIVFVAVMGFYWVRDGSLQSAGHEMDKDLAGIDRTTQPLQDAVGNVGEATKETVGRATDGDDKT